MMFIALCGLLLSSCHVRWTGNRFNPMVGQVTVYMQILCVHSKSHFNNSIGVSVTDLAFFVLNNMVSENLIYTISC